MMRWIAVADQEPSGLFLMFVDGEFYVAVLHIDESGPAYMGAYDWSLLPEPTYWAPLEPPPGEFVRPGVLD